MQIALLHGRKCERKIRRRNMTIKIVENIEGAIFELRRGLSKIIEEEGLRSRTLIEWRVVEKDCSKKFSKYLEFFIVI